MASAPEGLLPFLAHDVVPAAAVFLLGAGIGGPVHQGSSGGLLLHLALALPLVWRRRAPLAVFSAVAAAAFVQWLTGIETMADAALLVALYTVASRSTLRRTLTAALVLEAGILLAAARWSAPEGGFLRSVVFLTAIAVAVAVAGTNVRLRRSHLTSLEDRAVRLERERDQRARLAVASERARIAREMHDIVTHNLSVMVALADGAVFAQHRSPDRASAAMRQISSTGRQAIADMRRVLGVLRADEPDEARHPMPGIEQLAALADRMGAAGLSATLALEGESAGVPVTAQLTVYRIVQEALTNILKHASSGARAQVRVRCSSDAVTVDVTDDGHAAAARPPSPGHGILGMRERAAAYGGVLEAGPLPGRGWRVHATLNLGTAESGAA
ncbi:sensor histidine kinase [Planobispora rosea]|uniref:sensor histidine kinase n=1 Tax=Planobispora rosea TaxID=35762 RepID=UPI00114D35CC|nr:histidine kinase [Planobispora rosea]